MPANAKLIRWFDLMAALLRRRFPVSFADLSREVPAYTHEGTPSETLLRMFERDKDELRAAGIAIETVTSADGDATEYRLRTESFYLPYLVLATSVAAPPLATRSSGTNYGRVPTLAVLPDETVMLRRAAERVRTLGEPQLVQDAERALRKLRYDLPEELAAPAGPPQQGDTTLFPLLHDGVLRRKQITFTYHSIGRGATDARTVEPYGLVYLTGNWYVVAYDPAAQGRRHFRTSRMQNVRINAKAPGTPDFVVPPDFELRQHAKSRQAWELGTGDVEAINVAFVRQRAETSAAMQLGAELASTVAENAYAQRRYSVRRRDTFLRWLLAFGGDAVPVAPSEVVRDWHTLLRATYAAHVNAEVSA